MFELLTNLAHAQQPDKPKTNQHTPQQPDKPKTNQHTPQQPDKPKTNQHTPRQPDKPKTNQHTPQQPDKPKTNQHTPQQPDKLKSVIDTVITAFLFNKQLRHFSGHLFDMHQYVVGIVSVILKCSFTDNYCMLFNYTV